MNTQQSSTFGRRLLSSLRAITLIPTKPRSGHLQERSLSKPLLLALALMPLGLPNAVASEPGGGNNSGSTYVAISTHAVKNHEGTACLMPTGLSDGANVELRSCDSTYTSTSWTLYDTGEMIFHSGGRYCLDIASGNLNVGTNVQLHSCNGSYAQRWQYTALGEIQSLADPRYCLDNISSQLGDNVYLYSCHGGNNQKWSSVDAFDAMQGQAGKMAVKNLNGSTCLQPNILADGANVGMRFCNGDRDEDWQLNAKGEIRNLADPSYCLDVAYANFSAGTNVRLVKCSGHDAQKWGYTPKGELSPLAAPNLCLDSSAMYAGENAYLFDCHDGGNQKWASEAAFDGVKWTSITAKDNSQDCMHVENGSTAAGANVHMFSCDGSEYQQWQLMSSGHVRSGVNPGLCLDIDNAVYSSGTNIKVIGCKEGDSNGEHNAQRFFLTAQGHLKPVVAPNLCVARWQNNVSLGDCDDSAIQKWAVPNIHPDSGSMLVRTNVDGLCLLPAGNLAKGADVRIGHCAIAGNTSRQEWILMPDGALRNAANPNLCLDVHNSNFNLGANVQMWGCNGGWAQKWFYTLDNELRPQASAGLCVDGLYTRPGDSAYLHHCHGGGNQKWTSARAFAASRWAPITVKSNDNLCLHIENSNEAPGTNVHMYSCNGGDNQKWLLADTGHVRSALNPALCLDVYDANFNSGTNVQVYYCHDGNAQKWFLTPEGELKPKAALNLCLDATYSQSGDNAYLHHCHGGDNQKWLSKDGAFALVQWATIKPVENPNICMDVHEASSAWGVNVQVYNCTGNKAQAWRLTADGEIRSAVHPDRCLDVHNANFNQGANVQSYVCHGGDAQKWHITKKGEIRPDANRNLCLDATYSNSTDNLYLHACHGGDNQRWTSELFNEIKLQYVDGIYSLIYTNGGQHFAITNPVDVLQLLYDMGYSEQSLIAVSNLFSAKQQQILKAEMANAQHDTVYDIAAEGSVGNKRVAEVLVFTGPSGSVRFYESKTAVEYRMSATVAQLEIEAAQDFNLKFTALEYGAGVNGGSGGVGVNVGASMASGGFTAGNEKNYVGMGAGIGVGFEGALKFGDDDMYGFTLDVKFLKVEMYVSEYTATTTAEIAWGLVKLAAWSLF